MGLSYFKGIVLGCLVAIGVLFLSKNEDYIHFWNYTGIIIFPILYFIIFAVILFCATGISKLFKIDRLTPGSDFFIIGVFFGFFALLGEFCLINPILNKLGKINSSLTIFIDFLISYFMGPIILYLLILVIYNIITKTKY